MDPLEQAIAAVLSCPPGEPAGPKITFEAGWDATIVFGTPLFDGLIIATGRPQGRPSWVR